MYNREALIVDDKPVQGIGDLSTMESFPVAHRRELSVYEGTWFIAELNQVAAASWRKKEECDTLPVVDVLLGLLQVELQQKPLAYMVGSAQPPPNISRF